MTVYEWHTANKRARCRMASAVLTVAQKPGSPRWVWTMVPDEQAERQRLGLAYPRAAG